MTHYHTNTIIFGITVSADAAVKLTGVIAPAVFQQRAIGQFTGIILYGFGKPQRQIITPHITVRTAFITHIAASRSSEHFRAASASCLYSVGNTAAGHRICTTVDKRGTGNLRLYRRFALFRCFGRSFIHCSNDTITAQISCKFVLDADTLLQPAISNAVSCYTVAVGQQIYLITDLQDTGRTCHTYVDIAAGNISTFIISQGQYRISINGILL